MVGPFRHEVNVTLKKNEHPTWILFKLILTKCVRTFTSLAECSARLLMLTSNAFLSYISRLAMFERDSNGDVQPHTRVRRLRVTCAACTWIYKTVFDDFVE